jgi:hypothetical protein
VVGPRDASRPIRCRGGIHVVVWYLENDQLLDGGAKADTPAVCPIVVPSTRLFFFLVHRKDTGIESRIDS